MMVIVIWWWIWGKCIHMISDKVWH
jgi:hypothetical protein